MQGPESPTQHINSREQLLRGGESSDLMALMLTETSSLTDRDGISREDIAASYFVFCVLSCCKNAGICEQIEPHHPILERK